MNPKCADCRWYIIPPDDEDPTTRSLRDEDDDEAAGECHAEAPRVFLRKPVQGEDADGQPYVTESIWPNVDPNDECRWFFPREATPKICQTCRLFRPAGGSDDKEGKGTCCGPLPDDEGARPEMDEYDTCAGWEPRPEFQVFMPGTAL